MNDPHAEGNVTNDRTASDSPSPERAEPEGSRAEFPDRRSSEWLQENRASAGETSEFEEARRREEQFRLLEEEATEYAIVLLGEEGNVVSWNRGGEQLTGYSEEEILGCHLSVFYPSEDREAGVPERALTTAAREGSWTGTGWRVRKDGSRFWAQERLRAIVRESEKPQGFARVVHDLSSRRQLQRELLQVQEEEWRRIKADLHQVTGSQLTGANLLMDRVQHEVQDDELAGQLQKIRTLISESCEALQKISRKLTPTGLSRGGLSEALARLAEDTEGGHFEAGALDNGSSKGGAPESERQLPQLEEETASQLYWIAREATTAARRRKGTDEITLRLTEEEDALVLLMKDDGERGPRSEHDESSLAHRIMRHRADLLGATLTVESFPGDGTRVQCRLPM